jgi:hypothetical protein
MHRHTSTRMHVTLYCTAAAGDDHDDVLQGELMVATNLFAVYGKPATLSRITLAFMQDTGWYEVDWEQAGEYWRQHSLHSMDV